MEQGDSLEFIRLLGKASLSLLGVPEEFQCLFVSKLDVIKFSERNSMIFNLSHREVGGYTGLGEAQGTVPGQSRTRV